MKKLMMMAALVLGVYAGAEAQEVKKDRSSFKDMTPEQRAEKHAAHLQEALQLTDDQKKALYELNLVSGKEMKASRGQNKEEAQALRKNKEERMKAILSADQFAKYQAMKAERMQKMKERRTGDKRGNHRGTGTGQQQQKG
jgi:Spy/CpxP family protein refolding chaperone